jgi:5-methylcytosine-specific restriction enzyme B
MSIEGFKDWLEANNDQNYASTTISTKVSEAKRLEKIYGDLDGHYDRDEFASVLQSLQYTKTDERAGKEAPKGFEIEDADKNSLYNSLASHRSALTGYYKKYREAEAASARGSDAEEALLTHFDDAADFKNRRQSWSKEMIQSFCLIAESIHDTGLDWYNIGYKLANEQIRIGRKDQKADSADGAIGHLSLTRGSATLEIGRNGKQLGLDGKYQLDLNDAKQLVSKIKNAEENIRKWRPEAAGPIGRWPDQYPNHPLKNAQSIVPTATPTSHPLNLILHGPPGTGKTYATAKYAVEMCGEVAPEDRHELMATYDRLNEAGRIAFVTFHQSFAYEDFVEGLRPEPIEGGSGFELLPRNGVLKEIAGRAGAKTENLGDTEIDLTGRSFFKTSLGRAFNEEDAPLYDDCIENCYIGTGYGGDVDFSAPEFENYSAIKDRWRQVDEHAVPNDPNIQLIFALRSWMKKGDIVIVSEGNLKFRAIGEVTGDYEFATDEQPYYRHRRKVRWLWKTDKALPYSLIQSKKFSQMSLYNLSNAGLKLDAIAAKIAPTQSVAGGPLPHVLIIDEINRANVSKTFGELITLLEDDKRLGAENQLKVTLPYSGESFGLPQNLHVLGTMNTADRSIALLDTALRRRFAFEELMPDPAVLTAAIGGIPASAILRGLNERVEWLYDRDHLIGHAWLIGADTDEELSARFKTKIIPLLQEYFHEDWSRVRAALGEVGDQALFVKKIKLAAPLGFEGAQERYRYEVQPGPYGAAAWAQVAGTHVL